MSEVHDLGVLDGDLLLFGGPYSNLQACQALMAWAESAKIPPSHRICTGDIIAYGGDPRAALDLIRTLGGPVVAGNCEVLLAKNAEDCGCGFDAGSTCAVLSRDWYAHARTQVTDADRDWFRGLPRRLTFWHANKRYAVIHGGAGDVSRFLWPVSSDDDFWHEISLLQEEVGRIDGVIAGHCGIGFVRNIDGIQWINAGVIGMPPNDGAPETGFAVLSNGEVRSECLSYDVEAAVAAMTAAGLTQGYEQSLKTGYWPSEEVLPRAMRRQSRAIG